jgi:hypothetical protein
MMVFSVPAPLLLDHQLLVAKIANVGKLSLSPSVSNIPSVASYYFRNTSFHKAWS